MEKSMKLCLSYYPLEYPSFLRKLMGHRTYELLCKAGYYKRNPRSIEYMQDLASQMLGANFEVIDARDISLEKLEHVSEIVLLWPDGNGYGWFGIERRVMAHSKQLKAKITVLNGRRRYFSFSRVVWGRYLVRRFAERFWIGEVFFSILFLLVSPFMAGWDLVRGRR